MVDVNSLAITLPTIISIGMLAIATATYFGNRKKQNKDDTNKAITDSNQQVALLTSIDTRLSAIEKNTEVQTKHLEKHDDEIHSIDTRVAVLENKKTKRKK